jgi:dihydroorotase
MYDVVFRQATTVVRGQVRVADVAVRAGRIERVDDRIGALAAEEVLCEGLVLLPGAIDLHVHLREPGGSHKEDVASGTAAAVAGGITTVLDMPNTSPATTTLEALEAKAAIARGAARCNVRFFVGLTHDNVGELERAIRHPDFAGVKVYLGSTTGDLLVTDPAVVDRALNAVPALFAFHAELESVLATTRGSMEDPDVTAHHVLRPAEAADEGALLVTELAGVPGRRLHVCHLSSKREVEILSCGNQLASPVTSEVTPHHLFFTEADAAHQGNRLKVNPPIRYASDRDALRAALAGGRIAAVASDHAPHTAEEKAQPYYRAPSGVPGLDTLVPAVLRLVQLGELTLAIAVAVLAENPARIAGLRDKGRIEEDADADLALYDLTRSWTPLPADLRTRCGWTPFEGVTLGPRPMSVWVGGKRVRL